MRPFKLVTLLFIFSLIGLTLSCSILQDRNLIKGEVISIAGGDGGEGTVILIDKGSAAGIELNQEGWILKMGKTVATIMVEEVDPDICRAVVLEHEPFKPVAEGLTVLFDTNGTILSPEALTPVKPCPDIPGPYVPTVGGNMARTGSYDEKGVPSPIGVLWRIRTDRWALEAEDVGDSYSPLVTEGLVFLRGGSFFAKEGMTAEEKCRIHELMIGYEAPTILDEAIYNPGEGSFSAYNAKTRVEKWRLDISTNTPALTKDRVFVTSKDVNCTLFALDAETGKEIWHIRTEPTEERLSRKGDIIINTMPSLYDDTVYFQGSDFYLYAVEITTGKITWKYDVGSYVTSSCVIVGQDAIYIDDCIFIVALDKETGVLKWRFRTEVCPKRAPAVACGVVYVVDPWSLRALDARTGNKKWRFDFKDLGITSPRRSYDPPIVVDGVVYFGGLDESVYAVDADTGKLLWSYKTEFKTSTPVIVDGVLYVTSGPYLYAIK